MSLINGLHDTILVCLSDVVATKGAVTECNSLQILSVVNMCYLSYDSSFNDAGGLL